MTTIQLTSTEGIGTLVFEETKEGGPIEYTITSPVSKIKNQLNKYLTTEREYLIPESQKLDDYREDKEVPTKNLMYFELAMMEYQGKTGVLVQWPIDAQGLEQIEV